MEQTSLNFNPSPPSDEGAILSLLRHGRENALSSTEIERRTGLKPRRVQQIVRKLRIEGQGIGSATQDPMGYYLTDRQNDNVEMARKLRARGIKVLMVAAKFQRASLDMTFAQAKIEMEKCKEGVG